MFKVLLTFVTMIILSPVEGNERELFFVNVEEIKAIAISAAYEKYPDIPDDGLVDGDKHIGLNVRCESALQMKLVKITEEDFQHCSVQLHYDVRDTIFENRYIDQSGGCMLENGAEGIAVLVYSDGSTIVSRRGLNTSKGLVECTEDFEHLSK